MSEPTQALLEKPLTMEELRTMLTLYVDNPPIRRQIEQAIARRLRGLQ